MRVQWEGKLDRLNTQTHSLCLCLCVTVYCVDLCCVGKRMKFICKNKADVNDVTREVLGVVLCTFLSMRILNSVCRC